MTEVLFGYKEVRENGDVVEMRILSVPKSEQQLEGISYSCVYIHKGGRVLGYDNFEGHEGELRHHKHVGDRIIPYAFIDVWKLIEDFVTDVEKLTRWEK